MRLVKLHMAWLRREKREELGELTKDLFCDIIEM